MPGGLPFVDTRDKPDTLSIPESAGVKPYILSIPERARVKPDILFLPEKAGPDTLSLWERAGVRVAWRKQNVVTPTTRS